VLAPADVFPWLLPVVENFLIGQGPV
jgi:hypothetical protein